MSTKPAQPETDIIKIVNDIIVQAIMQGASDIHIEPQVAELVIRYRVDGLLKIIHKAHLQTGQLIVSRIKVMCQLDTTGQPRPQEGNIKFSFGERSVDLRVSIFPTSHGEVVVLRILESVKIYTNYELLGFMPEQARVVEETIKRPFGLILVTGPTGSGKSTTLFTMLDKLNDPARSLVTLEDPVERKLDMARQTQINPETGLTFAAGLRYLLRQDPNIIMVGEIRDSETADIAVQAAITGSLVISTIHTNNAAGAIVRLINLGVEPFLLSTALRLVTAQRLARMNCPECLAEYTPPQELYSALGLDPARKFYKSTGCQACNQLGVRGRIGVHQVLTVNDDIQALILKNPSDEQVDQLAVKNGMMTLRNAALAKAYEGVISIEEVVRLTE